MGITGLLPLLKPISRKEHISRYSGKTIAIDGHSWLHKGMYGAALDVCLGKTTTKYIDYCKSRLSMLLSVGIRPILVFDGNNLPIKSIKEAERRMARERARQLLDKALARNDRSSAWCIANRCVDITSNMVHELILVLLEHGIDYLVAPYEADAQMAYLDKHGLVDAVMTEDSDLVLFGCRQILYKFQSNGNVERINQQDIFETKSPDLSSFDLSMLRQMCILTGCDYLSSIPKIGLKTAHRYMNMYRTADKVLRALGASGQFVLPPNYRTMFELAELTFKHQRVFDPITGTMVFLTNVHEPDRKDGWNFLGPHLNSETVRRIAVGELCPLTLRKFGPKNPEEYRGWRDWCAQWVLMRGLPPPCPAGATI